MSKSRWAPTAVAAVLVAILAAPLSAQEVDIKPTKKPKRDKNVITAEEIAEHKEVMDGYDVVKVLRNQWLRVTRSRGSALSSMGTSTPLRPPPGGCRPGSTDPYCQEAAGTGSSGTPVPTERGSPYAESEVTSAVGAAGPVLYIDEIKRERLDELKTLKPDDIFEMRYMNGTEASGRYGSGHENGAILVKTIRFGKG